MKFKKLISQSLSHFDNDCFRVEKTKGLRILRVYFPDDFLAGIVIERLLSLDGLIFVGINTTDKYLSFTY